MCLGVAWPTLRNLNRCLLCARPSGVLRVSATRASSLAPLLARLIPVQYHHQKANRIGGVSDYVVGAGAGVTTPLTWCDRSGRLKRIKSANPMLVIIVSLSTGAPAYAQLLSLSQIVCTLFMFV